MFNNPEPRKKVTNTPQYSYPICQTIRLTIPSTLPNNSFAEVIQKRKSSREYKRLSIDQLSSLLWLACKVKDLAIDSTGYILTHRPSASAGGRHPIDVLILSPVLDKGSTLYYYNPFEHTLNKLSLEKQQVSELRSHINTAVNSRNATILWFLAHPSRTESKYKNAISLVWRDAGALIHCVQIASVLCNINSCAIGTLGEPYISKLFSNSKEIWSAGGILVG